MGVREPKAKRSAGITNNNGAQISRCFLGRKEQATGSWMIADSLSRKTPGRPHLAPGDSILRYSQNVAGLWLKYGVKSLKIETSSQRGILCGGDDLSTTTVDNADWAGL